MNNDILNNIPKWDTEVKPHIGDYIIKCFGKGLDRDKTYWACASYLYLKNKSEKQALADYIAQLDTINVMATGVIPT